MLQRILAKETVYEFIFDGINGMAFFALDQFVAFFTAIANYGLVCFRFVFIFVHVFAEGTVRKFVDFLATF